MTTVPALTVLVAESDAHLGLALIAGLQSEGFVLYLANDGAGALAMHDVVRPDVVIVDVELEGVTGLDVCAELRRRSRVSIVAIAAPGSEADPVAPLEAGADDFVADPMRLRELAARTRAVARRADWITMPASAPRDGAIAVGDVSLHPASLEVTVAGRRVALAPPYFRLLEALVKNAGHVVTREELATAVGRGDPPHVRTVSNQMGRVRELLGPAPSGKERISVVRGRGYVFELPDAKPVPVAPGWIDARAGGARARARPAVGLAGTTTRAVVEASSKDPADQDRGLSGCVLCAACAAAERGDDPWAVARLATGYVRLNPVQHYPGAVLFVGKECLSELHLLVEPLRSAHLAEMAEVARAVVEAFPAQRLSCEVPSHIEDHLHWWLTPRPPGDPYAEVPIWRNPDFVRSYESQTLPCDDEALGRARRALRDALGRQGLEIERSYVLPELAHRSCTK